MRLRRLRQHAHHVLVGYSLHHMIHTVVLRVLHVTREDGLVGKLPRFDDVVAVVVVSAAARIEVTDRLLLHLVCAADSHLFVCQGSDILADDIRVRVRIAARFVISADKRLGVAGVAHGKTAVYAHALWQEEAVTRRVAVHTCQVARRIIGTLGYEDLKRQVVGSRLVETFIGIQCIFVRTLLDDIVDGILQVLHRIGKRRSLLTVVFLHAARLGCIDEVHHGLRGIHVHVFGFCHEEAQHELAVAQNLVECPCSHLYVGAVIGCRHLSVHVHEVGG